jgi:thioredoxin reductase (NADPH)
MMAKNKEIHDLIIIGAGPAGLTAAIYARRAELDVMMIESSAPGGKMVKTNEIENWPGTPKVSGPDLASQMFEHATSLGAIYQYGVVTSIVPGDIKEVHTEDESVYYARAIIIATGTLERKLKIPGEDRLVNKGVSYCAICDGAFFKDKVITVIGGGNSALEEANYLTQFGSKVNVVVRKDTFKADKAVVQAVSKNPRINIIKSHIPIEIVGEDKVEGIILEDVKSKKQKKLETAAVFPFIGLDPISNFTSGLDIVDDNGYIVSDVTMKTKHNGIYAAGDVNHKGLRQVVTATNDGAIAAQEVIKYLENKK